MTATILASAAASPAVADGVARPRPLDGRRKPRRPETPTRLGRARSHVLVAPAHEGCLPISHNRAPIREKGQAPGVRRSSQALDGAAGVTPIVHHRRRLRPSNVIAHGPLFLARHLDVEFYTRAWEASAYHALDLLPTPKKEPS